MPTETHYVEGPEAFAPLRAYLARNPHQHQLPWEYMGHDARGSAHYRERQHGNRLCLAPSGRFAAIHREVVR